MEEIKKIIYFGTGMHLECVSHFSHVPEIVLVDTQPRSEFDGEHFDPIFYNETFIENLLCIGTKHMLVLTDIRELDTPYSPNNHQLPYLNPTLLTFVSNSTNQIIRYYISTNIRYNLIPELLVDVKEADALIVSGYFPDKIVYDYFDKRKQYIGYSQTCYRIPKEEMTDTIYCDLFSDKYFDSYYLVDYENGAITKYNNFKDFVTNKNKGTL